VLHGDELLVRDRRPSPWRLHPAVAAGLVLMALTFLLNLTPTMVVAIAVGTVLGIQTTVAVDRGRRIAEDLATPLSHDQVACAVSDGLEAAGLIPAGAATTGEEGDRRLNGVDASVAALFTAALEEVLAPVVAPSYLIPRWVLTRPVDNSQGVQVALGRLRPDAVVWHSVPAAASTSDERAQAFAGAWDRWVGGGPAVATDSAQGRAAVARSRGVDPLLGGTMVWWQD
jgi:hypothetical protein